MRCSDLVEKTHRKIRKIVYINKYGKSRKNLYISYWHKKLRKKTCNKDVEDFFFSAIPNRGAGIGHQMANWIAGYWFSKFFDIKFAHVPFSTDEWERFLGFGNGEKTLKDLIKQGYKCVRLPLFEENEENNIIEIKKIMKSYSGKKIVFLAEQDQFYKNQFGVQKEIQEKFYSCIARNNQELLFDSNYFNIALHIRRGDIVQKNAKDNVNLSMRFQDNNYFISALKTALNFIRTEKAIRIYIFSQGKEEEYPELKKMDNVYFCLDMSAKDSFLHMVYADALITSRSSFSYKPALLSKGIKFCPSNFWHGYPEQDDWILLDESGSIIKERE